jgi:hypothetical protein
MRQSLLLQPPLQKASTLRFICRPAVITMQNKYLPAPARLQIPQDLEQAKRILPARKSHQQSLARVKKLLLPNGALYPQVERREPGHSLLLLTYNPDPTCRYGIP